MGFDFRIASPPPKWPARYRPQYEDAPEYFRVTHKSMHALRAALVATGAIDVEARVPSFPPWPPAPMGKLRAMAVELSTMGDPAASVDPPSTASEIAVLEQWRAKRAAALETTSADPEKVPAFKLNSNDGWHLTAEECRVLATALAATLADRAGDLCAAIEDAGSMLSRDDALAWLSSFAEYASVAAEHGGVVVS